jgi:hypothetical protein
VISDDLRREELKAAVEQYAKKYLGWDSFVDSVCDLLVEIGID